MIPKIPKITQAHWVAAVKEIGVGWDGFYSICNKATEIALAEQSEPQEPYITAAQARELGAGNAEWKCNRDRAPWNICTEENCEYAPSYIYRAIKQAQPEPADPHATLRAEYAKQVALGSAGFYLWEFQNTLGGHWKKTEAPNIPAFYEKHQYRCTDISCMVSRDGEPAIRMLRTEAQELYHKLGDTVEWKHNNNTIAFTHKRDFHDCKGVYTYRTKATIKLDGKIVTLEQAMTEWKAKKDTHNLYWKNTDDSNICLSPLWHAFDDVDKHEYELRPKALKLKQLDWGNVPIGTMTNKGEFRGVYIDHHFETLADIETISDSVLGMGWRVDGLSDLRIAPASEQKWIARQDGVFTLYEGLTYREQRDNTPYTIAYKVTGLAEGYTDGGDV